MERVPSGCLVLKHRVLNILSEAEGRIQGAGEETAGRVMS